MPGLDALVRLSVADGLGATDDLAVPLPWRKFARLADVRTQSVATALTAAVPWRGVIVSLGVTQRSEEFAYEQQNDHGVPSLLDSGTYD